MNYKNKTEESECTTDAKQVAICNMTKLREALERIKKFVEGQCEIANDDARAILDIIEAALAAAPRNCDVGTATAHPTCCILRQMRLSDGVRPSPEFCRNIKA